MYEQPTYEEILAGANAAEARAKADRRNRIEEESGPQPPIPFAATLQLRWMLSPTPGERPKLQQLWRCQDEDAASRGECLMEEWRDVPFVDWNEQPVV
jgi:hypothetical protein